MPRHRRPPPRDDMLAVPPPLRARVAEIVAITDPFAAEHLDDEHAALCRRMAARLARQRATPIARGTARVWAATIVHAVGWVNFLGDPSQVPHMRSADLAARMGVGQSTIALRFRELRDALALMPMDPEWTPPSRMKDNPVAWLILVDGVPMDARVAPREIQEEALRAGAIPFLPTADDMPDISGIPGFPGIPDLSGLPGTEDMPPEAFLEEMMAEATAALELLLGRNPDATIDEINAELAGMGAGHNARPQADFGGLSPRAMQRLLDDEWSSGDGAIQLDASLSLDDLASSDLLHDARVLLDLLAAPDGVKATPKGNLPRTVVAAFRERMRPVGAMDARWYAESPPRNEEDLMPLHLLRNLLELGGLVKRRSGRISRTRHGAQLSAPARAGELFALLLRVHFRGLNLAWLDRMPDAPGFQYTVGYTLYRFAQLDDTWRTSRDLAPALVHPLVDVELAPGPYGVGDAALMLELRFLRPLVRFGLAESRENERAAGDFLARSSYRPSALLGRAVGFGVGDAG